MEPNLSQTLHLLNGDTVESKIASRNAVRRLLAERREPMAVVEELFMRCLSRKPTPEEASKIQAVLRNEKAPQPVLEDVFWALLNSKEFLFNH